MPFTKKPLPDLIEKGRPDQNGFGYTEFEKIAKLSKRPSFNSIALLYGRHAKTIKKWLERFDEEGK